MSRVNNHLGDGVLSKRTIRVPGLVLPPYRIVG
jgi:hypothetical protein